MRTVLQALSWLLLAATLLPSVLFFWDKITLDQLKTAMLVSMVLWFVVTPLWMGRQQAH